MIAKIVVDSTTISFLTDTDVQVATFTKDNLYVGLGIDVVILYRDANTKLNLKAEWFISPTFANNGELYDYLDANIGVSGGGDPNTYSNGVQKVGNDVRLGGEITDLTDLIDSELFFENSAIRYFFRNLIELGFLNKTITPNVITTVNASAGALVRSKGLLRTQLGLKRFDSTSLNLEAYSNEPTFKGIEYGGVDPTPNFTDFSLVHKKYVTNYVDAFLVGIGGGLTPKGLWNASTNTPTLASGVGTNNDFYIVSTAGTTNLDGYNDWGVDDWAVFLNGGWYKLDNSDVVKSVNGQIGAVVLNKADIGLANVDNTSDLAKNESFNYLPTTDKIMFDDFLPYGNATDGFGELGWVSVGGTMSTGSALSDESNHAGYVRKVIQTANQVTSFVLTSSRYPFRVIKKKLFIFKVDRYLNNHFAIGLASNFATVLPATPDTTGSNIMLVKRLANTNFEFCIKANADALATYVDTGVVASNAWFVFEFEKTSPTNVRFRIGSTYATLGAWVDIATVMLNTEVMSAGHYQHNTDGVFSVFFFDYFATHWLEANR